MCVCVCVCVCATPGETYEISPHRCSPLFFI